MRFGKGAIHQLSWRGRESLINIHRLAAWSIPKEGELGSLGERIPR
jgi:hypothetical protein